MTVAVESLHAWFEEGARRWPERCAVIAGERRMSYAELDAVTTSMASRLRGAELDLGQPVGVHATRSVDTVVALLSVLKAGGCYLPLDPASPTLRVQRMISEGGVRAVVGEPSGARHYESIGVDYIAVTDDDGGAPPPSALPRAPGSAAYTLFTSGSTGTPKGVVVTHQNVIRLFRSTESIFGFGPDDVWTLFHSVAFDFSVWELWGALLYGGTLVVVPYETSRSPHDLLRLLRQERVTVFNQTPSAFRQLLGEFDSMPEPLLELRLLIFGGETLDPTLLVKWRERHPEVRVVNMYGITETTVHVTLHEISEADTAISASVIGSALPDLTVHLLDEHLGEVPNGVVGEIYVSGPGLAAGYLGRPGLTAARFVADPFGPPGSRMYRSGDLAVRTPQGSLAFVGRNDRQVSVRGFRIELGEIEAAARDVPRVRDAVARLWTSSEGYERIVCYLLGDIDPDAVRRALAERLPAHSVPGACLAIDSIPLTANGKIDEAALPAPVELASTPLMQAATAVEKLQQLFGSMLGLDNVGPSDDLFALGGDSMLAVRLVAAARAAGVQITVPQLFAHPTPGKLASLAANQDSEAGLYETSPVRFTGSEGGQLIYPASLLQLGMIYHSDVSGDPTLYHDLVSARVRGPFDLAALKGAIESAVRRHEALRTRFDFASFDEQVQVVLADADVTVELVHTGGGDPDEEVQAWWDGQWHTPFDPETGPLLRCHVLLHAPELVEVALSAHHAILDGWSFAVLVVEILEDYDAMLLGLEAPRREAPPSFQEFVIRERRALEADDSLQFWRESLAGQTALQWPAPRLDERAPGLFPDEVRDLPAESVLMLHRLARGLGVPVKSVALAIHCAALGEILGRDDVVTGVVVNARPDVSGIEETLGLFVNSLPLRARLGASPAEIVRGVVSAERSLIEHRHLPLAAIQRELGWDPVGALFNYVDFHPFRALSKLRAVEVTDWWSCDRTNVPVVMELASAPIAKTWQLTVRVNKGETASSVGHELLTAFLRQLERFGREIG